MRNKNKLKSHYFKFYYEHKWVLNVKCKIISFKENRLEIEYRDPIYFIPSRKIINKQDLLFL